MVYPSPCLTCKETEELVAALQESIRSLEHEIELARAENDQEAIRKYEKALADTRVECRQLLDELASLAGDGAG